LLIHFADNNNAQIWNSPKFLRLCSPQVLATIVINQLKHRSIAVPEERKVLKTMVTECVGDWVDEMSIEIARQLKDAAQLHRNWNQKTFFENWIAALFYSSSVQVFEKIESILSPAIDRFELEHLKGILSLRRVFHLEFND
jgi:hypothetical protein